MMATVISYESGLTGLKRYIVPSFVCESWIKSSQLFDSKLCRLSDKSRPVNIEIVKFTKKENHKISIASIGL